MNKYLRAVGFTQLPQRSEIQNIIEEGLKSPDDRAYTVDEENEDVLLGQFGIILNTRKEAAGAGSNARGVNCAADMSETDEKAISLVHQLFETERKTDSTGNHETETQRRNRHQIGLAICGQFNDKDEFFPDYYYPYLDYDGVSSTEEISVEPRIDNDTYAGVCDDLRVGAALIFRLRNTIEYRRNLHTSFLPLEHASVTLTALSLEGSVMLPIYKSADDISRKKNTEIKRRRLLNAARSGDENAMQNLTEADIATWTNILAQIQVDDVYTLIESYFMPYGAECELYSVMGDIIEYETLTNRITGAEVCVMRIESNGLPLSIAINREDLVGEPQTGRRFKGIIWLQGKINFPLMQDLSHPEDRRNRNST